MLLRGIAGRFWWACVLNTGAGWRCLLWWASVECGGSWIVLKPCLFVLESFVILRVLVVRKRVLCRRQYIPLHRIRVSFSSAPFWGRVLSLGKGDPARISRKLYFPADEVSRKRNFPTIPQTSTLLFRRSAFYSCLQYITAPLSVHISRSFRINSAFSVIYTTFLIVIISSFDL